MDASVVLIMSQPYYTAVNLVIPPQVIFGIFNFEPTRPEALPS